jgi:hypothetical protein
MHPFGRSSERVRLCGSIFPREHDSDETAAIPGSRIPRSSEATRNANANANANAHAGVTLEEAMAADAGTQAPGRAPVATVTVTDADVVKLVLFAAADAADASPRQLRPVLYATVRRARELGLTLEALERALAPDSGSGPQPGAAAPAAKSA